MIDPMSPKPLLLPRAGAAFAVAFSFSASSRAVLAARLSLHAALWSCQAASWHAALQYATSAQPEHVLNVTPFLGLSPHLPHKTISGG